MGTEFSSSKCRPISSYRIRHKSNTSNRTRYNNCSGHNSSSSSSNSSSLRWIKFKANCTISTRGATSTTARSSAMAKTQHRLGSAAVATRERTAHVARTDTPTCSVSKAAVASLNPTRISDQVVVLRPSEETHSCRSSTILRRRRAR